MAGWLTALLKSQVPLDPGNIFVNRFGIMYMRNQIEPSGDTTGLLHRKREY